MSLQKSIFSIQSTGIQAFFLICVWLWEWQCLYCISLEALYIMEYDLDVLGRMTLHSVHATGYGLETDVVLVVGSGL